jgi:hypothetical protein
MSPASRPMSPAASGLHSLGSISISHQRSTMTRCRGMLSTIPPGHRSRSPSETPGSPWKCDVPLRDGTDGENLGPRDPTTQRDPYWGKDVGAMNEQPQDVRKQTKRTRRAKKDPAVGMIRTPVNRPDYEDGPAAKLLKYIPAEVLAVFIPLVALADKISSGSGRPTQDHWIWITIGVAMFAVIGYSAWHATDQLKGQLRKAHHPGSEADYWDDDLQDEYDKLKPYPYFYLLAVVAFGAWALVTAQPVRRVVGLSVAQTEFIAGIVTFLMPLADATFAHFVKLLQPRGPTHSRSGAHSAT